MICPDCSAAAETKGHWRQYNSPGCLYCTARLIQQLRDIRATSAGIAARQRAVLEDAVALGHSEEEIRALAKFTELVLQPAEEKRKK